MAAKRGALKSVLSLMLVKDRIQQFYAQSAQLDKALTEFKRKHGYCGGTAYCMHYVGDEAHSCKDCLKQAANPKYKKRISEYGMIRRKEKEADRKSSTRAKRKKAA